MGGGEPGSRLAAQLRHILCLQTMVQGLGQVDGIAQTKVHSLVRPPKNVDARHRLSIECSPHEAGLQVCDVP